MLNSSHNLISRGRSLNLDQPKIMGILNCTPDSFSDGGQFNSLNKAYDRACQMYQAGASIIDIGGESTRPGASEISLDEEMSRVIPIVEKIAHNLDVMISIDSSSPELIKEGVQCGAHIWNDVRALTRENAIELAKELDIAICLMHIQGTPQNMQNNPQYNDVCKEVGEFLLNRVQACIQLGIDKNKIILDPGFGFGKTLEHNYTLLKHFASTLQDMDKEHNYHLLYGLSRKGMIGKVIHQDNPLNRVNGSVVGAFYSLLQGAHIIRVHDVEKSKEALDIFNMLNSIE